MYDVLVSACTVLTKCSYKIKMLRMYTISILLVFFFLLSGTDLHGVSVVLNVQKSLVSCLRRVQAFKQIVQKNGYCFNVVKHFPPLSIQPTVGFYAENFPVF